MRKQLADSVV